MLKKGKNQGNLRVMKNTNQNNFPKTSRQRYIDAINGLLIFEFFHNEFCIDLECLVEVKNVDDVQITINNSNEAIILWEDYEYKLIQLHKLVGYPELTSRSDNRVIFIDIFNKKIAFMVEKINELLTTGYLFVGNKISIDITHVKKYVKGAIKFQGRNIIIPDFERISKELNKLAIISGMVNSTKRNPENYNYSKGRNY